MASGPRIKQALVGREVAIAFAVIAIFYLVRVVRFQPLQLPAYLLIVAYDLVELAIPVLAPYHPIGFPVFLYLLAVVAAGAARGLRANEGEVVGWRQAVGGVCLVVGGLSLLFGAYVGGPLVSPTDNPTPLVIAAATGALLLVVGWGLLGRSSWRSVRW